MLRSRLNERLKRLRRAGTANIDGKHNPQFEGYVLAWDVLLHFLGPEWMAKHITAAKLDKPYLAVFAGLHGVSSTGVGRDPEAWHLHVNRVVDLAEKLFNLQWIDGFDAKLTQLAGGAVEDTFAELETAKLLTLMGWKFKFVTARGERGCDYDLEVQMTDGQWVCADTKSKTEVGQLTEAGIYSRLHESRTQFPPDRASFIFLRLPRQWVGADPEAKRIVDTAIGRFLRGTGRVASVKVHTTAEEPGIQMMTLWEVDNPKCRFLSDSWKISRMIDWRTACARWTFLFSLTDAEFDARGEIADSVRREVMAREK